MGQSFSYSTIKISYFKHEVIFFMEHVRATASVHENTGFHMNMIFPYSHIRAKYQNVHCVKSVRIRGYSAPYFPAVELIEIHRISPYSVRMRENTDKNNSEYGHFSRSYADLL